MDLGLFCWHHHLFPGVANFKICYLWAVIYTFVVTFCQGNMNTVSEMSGKYQKILKKPVAMNPVYGLEQISQIIGQFIMNPRNMLIQIIFRSSRFPFFTRMTAFLVNCKLSSWNISRWCGVTTLVKRSISGLMFFWWGVLVRPGRYTDLMAQLRCRWLTAEPWLHC